MVSHANAYISPAETQSRRGQYHCYLHLAEAINGFVALTYFIKDTHAKHCMFPFSVKTEKGKSVCLSVPASQRENI